MFSENGYTTISIFVKNIAMHVQKTLKKAIIPLDF